MALAFQEHSIREQALSFGPFRFLPQQRLLTRSGLPLRVGSRALDILSVLLVRAGDVVTKEEIIRQVWPNTVVEENNLRVHLTALRKLLGEGHVTGRFIENVPGRGYSFVASVERQNDLPDLPAAPAKPAPLNNLPGTVGEIIGRDAVIAALGNPASAAPADHLGGFRRSGKNDGGARRCGQTRRRVRGRRGLR